MNHAAILKTVSTFKAVQLKWGERAAIHLLRRKFGKPARYWDENMMRVFLALGV